MRSWALLHAILATIRVGGELRLIAFKRLPVDVALVMILQQDLAVPFGVELPDLAAMQRVPAIINLYPLVDMGRMAPQ